jgi:hypothetical protein
MSRSPQNNIERRQAPERCPIRRSGAPSYARNRDIVEDVNRLADTVRAGSGG